MLTVRDALAMEVFAGAKVVAGATGLGNEIRWVHIVDMPDSQFKWVKGGELLLTTGFGLKARPEKQATLVPDLAAKGMSGLVLSTGYYFDAAPKVMREAGDRLGFPIVEVPPELMFIDVTEAIFTRIVNEQYDLQQRAYAIHRRLTELVLEGGNLAQVAEALAGALERSVAIESAAFRTLAAAEHGPTDTLWSQSAPDQVPPELIQRFLGQGIYERLSAERRPLRVKPLPDLGMTMERVAASIIVDRQVYGYVWIIAGDRPLTELDTLAIDHAATVSALLMLRDKAVREAEQRARGDLFEQWLAGAAPEGPAHQLGMRLDRSHAVFVITGAAATADLAAEVERWLREEGQAALVVAREERVVAAIESKTAEHSRAVAEALDAALWPRSRAGDAERSRRDSPHAPTAFASPGATAHRERGDRAPILIGVGQAYPARAGLRRSYDEALEASQIGVLMGRRQGLVAFADLGLMHWLFHLSAEQQAENRYVQVVSDLRDYDEQHHGDLLHTLETYLDSGNALAEASAALNVHRNTLLYRLRRIEELTGLDLKNPANRLNLHIALKSFRIKAEKNRT